MSGAAIEPAFYDFRVRQITHLKPLFGEPCDGTVPASALGGATAQPRFPGKLDVSRQDFPGVKVPECL